MKAKIKISILKEALVIVNKVLPAKAPLEILESLYFDMFKITDSDYSTVQIKGSNLEETIIYQVELEELEGDMSFMLTNPHKLLSFISMHNDDEILSMNFKPRKTKIEEEQDMEATTGVLNLSVGKDKSKLPVLLDVSLYPEEPKLEDMNKVEISSIQNFRADLQKAKLFVASDELRPIMNGVHVNDKHMVATNSHYFMLKKLDYISTTDFTLNLPVSFINNIPSFKTDKNVELLYNNNIVFIDFGYIKLYSRMVNGSYPAYQSVIPRDFKAKVNISLGELKQVVKKSMLFGDEASGLLKLSIGEADIDITTEDPIFSRSFDGKIEHNGFEGHAIIAGTDNNNKPLNFNIGVKDKFLSLVLNSIIKKDEISISLNSESTSLVIKDEVELYLLMPMMLT